MGKPGFLFVAAQAAVLPTSVVLLFAKQKPALIIAAALVFGILRAICSPLLYSLIGEIRDNGLSSARAARVISLSWQLPLVLGPLIYSVGTTLGGREQFPLILAICNALSLLAAVPFLFKKSTPARRASFSVTQAVRVFARHRESQAPC